MKIHAILTTNNEADILEDCIRSALRWAFRIYVFDTGSTDNTRDTIRRLLSDRELAERVIHYKSEFRPFNWVKSTNEVFRNYFDQSENGDWWCTLCSDEIYRDNPLEVISRVPSQFNCVWMIMVNYYFTEHDLFRFHDKFGVKALEDLDEMHGFYKSFKYYTAAYSEPRFFKHTPLLTPEKLFTIKNFSRPWFDRPFMNHYQYRYPAQILRRIQDRRSIYKQSGHLRLFEHENSFGLSTLSDDDHAIDLFRKSGFLERVVRSSLLSSKPMPLIVNYQTMPRPNYSLNVFVGMAWITLLDKFKALAAKLSVLGDYIVGLPTILRNSK